MKKIISIISKIKDELITVICQCAADILRKFEKIDKFVDNQDNRIKYKLVDVNKSLDIYCKIPEFIYSQRQFQTGDKILVKYGTTSISSIYSYVIKEIYYDTMCDVIVLLISHYDWWNMERNFTQCHYDEYYEVRNKVNELIISEDGNPTKILQYMKDCRRVILSDDEVSEKLIKDYISYHNKK